MIRGLWFFLQLAVLVVIAVFLAEQPGSVTIEWRGWLVETSAGFLVVIMIALAGILVLLWRIWRSVVTTPHEFHHELHSYGECLVTATYTIDAKQVRKIARLSSMLKWGGKNCAHRPRKLIISHGATANRFAPVSTCRIISG